MIRHARLDDEGAIRDLLRTVGLNGVERYTYTQMDGSCLVDDRDGIIRGVIRFFLGRPETWVRQIAVCRDAQGTTVARDLLSAVGKLAAEYGSEGVEGFVSFERPGFIWMAQRSGAVLHAGTRVRWFAMPPMGKESISITSAGA